MIFLDNSQFSLDESLAAAGVVVVQSSGLGSDALVKRRLAVVVEIPGAPLGHGKDLVEQAGCPRVASVAELAAALRCLLFDEAARPGQFAAAERFVEDFCGVLRRRFRRADRQIDLGYHRAQRGGALMKRWLQENIARAAEFLRNQEKARTMHALQRRGLLSLGRHTYGMPTIHSYHGSESRITIGSFCSIAPDVRIINGGIHPKSWVSLFPFRIMWNLDGAFADGMPETRGDIVIGSDVWLGTGATVLSGVTIGHGAIVAAGSLVTRDVAPYAIAAGIPAERLAFRFPPETVAKLLKIRWWEWDDARIREAVPLLSSSNIDRFLREYHFSCEG